MKLMLRFLRPHWKLTALTMALLILDVTGALFVPTLVAEMVNLGTSGAPFEAVFSGTDDLQPASANSDKRQHRAAITYLRIFSSFCIAIFFCSYYIIIYCKSSGVQYNLY